MRARALFVSAVLLAALAVAEVSSPSVEAAGATVCRDPIRVNVGGSPERYRIRVERDTVACATARNILARFIASRRSPRGWTCFRGHGRDPWAAACARGRSVVRAYLLR